MLSSPDELLVYECDGLPQHKHRPRAVVFPSSTEETAAVMQELARAHVPFTPRGAGTGLSGGALALNEGVVVELARMRKILKIDVPNKLAVVQPGVVNLHVSKAVAPFGLYYVPDPSSQPTCTIGGNIAESAGGIHCLKYGTTTDHVLGCRVVLAGGEIVDLGGAGTESNGLDLLGTFIGSEGTFGIVTEATLRLVQIPPAVRTLLAEFAEVNDASHAVSAIIAAGVMPAALEMMDKEIIRAVEASVFAAGLPPNAGAALLIELDGIEAGLDDEAERVTAICMEFGARNCRRARDDEERKKLWAARKGAFGAIGRISPDSMIQDAVVPRSRLPQVLASAYDIARKYELRIANVFHAGDGNLHPLICFDSRFPDQIIRVKEAGRELMQICVANGGTITGEHGVGLDKRELLPLVFSETDMNAMLSVRAAFDPEGLLNPGKIIPMLRGCGEARSVSPDSSGPDFTNVSRPTEKARSTTNVKRSFRSDDAAYRLSQLVDEVSVSPTGAVVVFPNSIETISEVLKLASTENWRVSAAGGMTGVVGSHASTNLIVSTMRLNQIIEHEPADLIAVAQAGTRLVDFNNVLSRNGQWLPLDPPDDGRATLGGVVATGLGGAQQHGYGRPRGSVIGMRVVLADGSVVRAGGRVVKNVAGYDLCKLFTGSYGNLGIITELNFKLRPRPASEATIVASGKSDLLLSFARSIIDSVLFPVAIELISNRVTKELGIDVAENECGLLVRFAGNQKGVDYQTERSLGLASAVGNCHRVNVDAKLWRDLAALPLKDSSRFSWRVNMLPSKIDGFLASLERIMGHDFTAASWHLGVGDGRMRMMDSIVRPSEATTDLVRALRALVRENEATIVFGESTSDQVDDEMSLSVKALSARIKQQLDPQGIFVGS